MQKKYLNTSPERMDANTWLRLKERFIGLQEVIDKVFPMTAEQP